MEVVEEKEEGKKGNFEIDDVAAISDFQRSLNWLREEFETKASEQISPISSYFYTFFKTVFGFLKRS